MVRFPIWFPKTAYGLLASVIAGATVAAICLAILGVPSLKAAVGTKAYSDQMQTIAVTLIATLSLGTWIGTRLERRRLLRLAASNEFRREMLAAANRLAARQGAANDAIAGLPWVGEAKARRAAAFDREFRIETVFDSLNPYFCLSFESLLRYGFASAEELAEMRSLVASMEFPHRWANPMILHDLELLDSREDALVRTGLSFRHMSPAT